MNVKDKLGLLGATILLGMGAMATPAAAQDAPAVEEEEVIVVTGSRIRRDTFSLPVPIAVISGDSIRESGAASLYDSLLNSPIIAPNQNDATTSGTLFLAGQARVDLRGLGATRTLVLADGRRLPFADGSSPAVDLNMLPSLMVERTESTTGAAAPVYGSDAVAGVVNLIMRRSYDGIMLDAQTGIAEEGDGEEQRYGVLWGRDFMEDRVHVLFGAEMARVEPIFNADRDYTNPGIRRNTLVAPQTVIRNSRSRASATGTLQLTGATGLLGGASATPRAVAIDYRDRSIDRLSAACAPRVVLPTCQDEVLPDRFGGYGGDALQGKTDRVSARGYVEFELTDNIMAFADITYNEVEGYGFFSPSFSNADGSGTMGRVTIFGDNPYLNGTAPNAADLRAEWTAAGLGFTNGSQALFSSLFVPIGYRNVRSERENWRYVGGMEGDFDLLNREINWDWYYALSTVEGATTSFNVPDVARVRQSFDAITLGGVAVCRDATARANGCAPWDFLQGPSQAAIDWVNANSTTVFEVTQNVGALNFATDLFELPAGPLAIAGGYEYRKEESEFTQDAVGASGRLFFNAIGRRAGEYDVNEFYGEVRVPVLADMPFARSLSVEYAVRQSDYSTVGKVDMWRAVAEYSPIEDITFRYNRGTSVRAPNIVELFSPQSRNFTTAAVDPCDSGQFAAVSAGQRAQRSVTCASMISGYNPLTFTSNIGPGRSSLALLQGGNPLLEEESARTEQIGFVFSPRFLENFRLSFDYFDYVVDDYISTIPIQTVFNLCYDSNDPTSANPFCAFIRRDPTGSSLNPAGGVPGGVSEVLLVNSNVANLKVQGYDMSIAYGFDVANLFGSDGDWGEFSARLDGTRQYKYDFKGDPSSPVQSLSRYANNAAPEWRANLTLQYARDIWNVAWSTVFVGDQIGSQTITPLSAYPAHTGDYYRHDLRVRLDFTDSFSLRGGILNLTEVAPPGLPEVYQGTGQGSSIYDNRGRFFYIGATFRH